MLISGNQNVVVKSRGLEVVEAGGGSKVDLDLMTWSLGSTRHGAMA